MDKSACVLSLLRHNGCLKGKLMKYGELWQYNSDVELRDYPESHIRGLSDGKQLEGYCL